MICKQPFDPAPLPPGTAGRIRARLLRRLHAEKPDGPAPRIALVAAVRALDSGAGRYTAQGRPMTMAEAQDMDPMTAELPDPAEAADAADAGHAAILPATPRPDREPMNDSAELDAQFAAWIAATSRRDEAAFTRLYDATVGRAWSLAMRIVRQQEAAEEVVEDCYWQVWREADRFDPARGRALTWILTICRSRALDYLRRKDIAEPHEDMDALRSAEPAGDDDPLELLAATDRASAVHAALLQLKPKERQLIALAFFRGLTHQEIALACAMPVGTVKTTMHKAFGRLRELLGGEGWEMPDE